MAATVFAVFVLACFATGLGLRCYTCIKDVVADNCVRTGIKNRCAADTIPRKYLPKPGGDDDEAGRAEDDTPKLGVADSSPEDKSFVCVRLIFRDIYKDKHIVDRHCGYMNTTTAEYCDNLRKGKYFQTSEFIEVKNTTSTSTTTEAPAPEEGEVAVDKSTRAPPDEGGRRLECFFCSTNLCNAAIGLTASAPFLPLSVVIIYKYFR